MVNRESNFRNSRRLSFFTNGHAIRIFTGVKFSEFKIIPRGMTFADALPYVEKGNCAGKSFGSRGFSTVAGAARFGLFHDGNDQPGPLGF
jgi:hypothetical protein